MTIEPIIIDGVDVAECEFFENDRGFKACGCQNDPVRETSNTGSCNCCDNANCYYKQL